jgi:hypothetical protein
VKTGGSTALELLYREIKSLGYNISYCYDHNKSDPDCVPDEGDQNSQSRLVISGPDVNFM